MAVLHVGGTKHKLTKKMIDWIRALPKDQLKAWLGRGVPESHALIDFDKGKTFFEARLNGVGLPGQFDTEDEAMLHALETQAQYLRETMGQPVPTPPGK